MGDCCGEYRCRRKQPIHIYKAILTDQVFAATRARQRRRADSKEIIPGSWEALEKHDVTEQVREFIRRNPEWVRTQLEREGPSDG